MRSLPYRAESDSAGDIDLNDFAPEESSGWFAPSDLERYFKNKESDRELVKKIIYKANKLVPLSSILFKNNNIEWIINDNHSGWTHKAKCPFPDHNDSTPSFGFNSKDERFHCFGCQRSGNTVQFLSFMEGRKFIEVAKELLSRIKNPENIIIELEENKADIISDILFEFSNNIRKFLQKNINYPSALQYVEAITWNLDLYLEKNSISGSIEVENLKARIEILNDYLDNYQHSI